MTGSMNFSMQMTLPFLLTLLQTSRAVWISCPLLTDVPVFLWIQRRLKSYRLLSLTICLLSPSQSMAIPFQMYRSSHTWVIYWVTAAAWTVKSSTVLKLLHLPSADWQNVSSSTTTLPYPLKWPFTGQSVSQLCCTVVRHGPSIDDTSRPLRHFTSAVCKASSASDGGRKYHTLSSLRKLE